MDWRPERVRDNIAGSTTADLLDRVTAYRDGMEPDAVTMIEAELFRRGVTGAELLTHADTVTANALRDGEGRILPCSYCPAPAVERGWDWCRLMHTIPIFPRPVRRCPAHALPATGADDADNLATS